MNIKRRLDKLEVTRLIEKKVYFLGWTDCEWKRAAGIERGLDESKELFFSRVKASTDKKWIWCY